MRWNSGAAFTRFLAAPALTCLPRCTTEISLGSPLPRNRARTSELYDVNAKAGKSAVDEMQKLGKDQRDVENQRMHQALLKDRFKMTLNRGTKDLPIYSLVVAKVGKLHEAQGDCGPEPPPWKPGMPPPPPPCGGLRVFNWVGRIDGLKVPINSIGCQPFGVY